MRFSSIKFKVALAATLLFLLAMAVISVIQARQLRAESSRILSDQQFTLVSHMAEDIEEKINTRRAVLGSEATLLPAEFVNQPEKLHQRFDDAIALHTLFDSFSVISAEGRVIYTTTEIPGWRTVNLSDRPYFKEVMEQRVPIISEPFLSKLQGRPRIAFAAPVFDGRDNIVGMLVGALDLMADNFLGDIGDMKIGKKGYFYLVANGPKPVYITHHIKSRIMEPAMPSAEKNPSLMRALQGYEGTLEGTNSYGLQGLFSFKNLDDVDWVLAAVLPSEEAFEPIKRTMITTLMVTLLISIMVAACIWWLVYRLLSPLETLRENMDHALSQPGASAIGAATIHRSDEIGRLTGKFNELMAARNIAEEQLAHAARHDVLTDLPNRMLFNDRLAQTLNRSRRNRQAMAVMYIDADYFKRVNDTLGHAAGDQLLVQFGQRITNCVRATDTVARLGGDEFAVILENVGRSDTAANIADKIVHAMRKPFNLAEGEVQATSSIGIAWAPVAPQEAHTLLKAADEALYTAKARGRNGRHMNTVEEAEQPASAALA